MLIDYERQDREADDEEEEALLNLQENKQRENYKFLSMAWREARHLLPSFY